VVPTPARLPGATLDPRHRPRLNHSHVQDGHGIATRAGGEKFSACPDGRPNNALKLTRSALVTVAAALAA
jgi:hypothetical protein